MLMEASEYSKHNTGPHFVLSICAPVSLLKQDKIVNKFILCILHLRVIAYSGLFEFYAQELWGKHLCSHKYRHL